MRLLSKLQVLLTCLLVSLKIFLIHVILLIGRESFLKVAAQKASHVTSTHARKKCSKHTTFDAGLAKRLSNAFGDEDKENVPYNLVLCLNKKKLQFFVRGPRNFLIMSRLFFQDRRRLVMANPALKYEYHKLELPGFEDTPCNLVSKLVMTHSP